MALHSDKALAEDESYFVSMTDLMVGMLFVFIIMLMAFALDLRDQEHKFSVTTATLTQADEARRLMLEEIRRSLMRRGVTVLVDPDNGVVRLPEELLFPQGEYELTARGRDALRKLADVLAIVLPCYSKSKLPESNCSQDHKGRLEAVFIEGHTDDRPIGGRLKNGVSNNWELSTERAIATFNALKQQVPALEDLSNDNGLSLLGVSGYAEFRPIRRDDSATARAANRRIDLRFLMETPTSAELKDIRRNVEGRHRAP